MSLLPIQDALALILASATHTTAIETISIHAAYGRTLASNLHAKRTQPPVNMSAMDGFAIRVADIATAPNTLTLIGQSTAGLGFDGDVIPQTCIRIFTGAPVPNGADTVVIQENTTQNGNQITILDTPSKGKNIRNAGIDFCENELLLHAGTRLGAAELSLIAAMNHTTINVRKRPIIGILATGDELVEVGTMPLPYQIISSNTLSISALAQESGAEIIDLGIAPDNLKTLTSILNKAQDLQLDVLVTSGGASVGDHDLVQKALHSLGCMPDFWRIAMRPGKPMMFGKLGNMRVLGLPGNPVASYVCSLIFLQPLIRAMQGDSDAGRDMSQPAILGCNVKANDKRQDYMRASAVFSNNALPVITPFELQDSSMLLTLAKANCLLIREPFAQATKIGDLCRIIKLGA
jgi:molybdopterin molybdotransferase